MDPWAISQSSFGCKTKQKLISKLAQDKIQLIRYNHTGERVWGEHLLDASSLSTAEGQGQTSVPRML